MLVINFAHPITHLQREQIETLTGRTIERVIDARVQVDMAQPLIPQIIALIDSIGLSPAEWQSLPLLVNLPSLNYAAAAVIAELHGRCGYFVPAVRLKQMVGTTPPQYEAAEILLLHEMRDNARRRR